MCHAMCVCVCYAGAMCVLCVSYVCASVWYVYALCVLCLCYVCIVSVLCVCYVKLNSGNWTLEAI